MGEDLKVLFIAAEAEPVIKVGGLGDVAGSLPLALRAVSRSSEWPVRLDIRLVLPFHTVLKDKALPVKACGDVFVASSAGLLWASVYQAGLGSESLPVYLIDGAPIQDGPGVYSDNSHLDGRKYIFFSLAALGLGELLGWAPDILHAHDWHTAAAVYQVARMRPLDASYQKVRTMLSVHNLPYTGAGSESAMDEFGLPPASHPDLPWWASHHPLPLGLLAADRVVAVSAGYAREICTPEFGAGLDGLLRSRGPNLTGILNGIDPSAWDPATDAEIPMKFSLSSLPARRRNKSALQMELGFPVRHSTFLMAMISRLVYQKGVDLAIEALYKLGDLDWQALVFGSGDPDLEYMARVLEGQFPGRVRAIIRFDPQLSRRVYAGADAILIPSRYEPSGLTQMIGMRYGCVPIARATGGLADTITHYSGSNDGTGFLFEYADPASLATTIRSAMGVFPDKRTWQSIQRRGMKQDFSWDRSARQYLSLYREMLQH